MAFPIRRRIAAPRLSLLALAALLAACGGDDDSGATLAPVAPVDVATLQQSFPVESGGIGGDSGGDGGAAGAAGDGSPLKNVVVTLVDATGKQVTGRTDDKGRFFLRFKTADFRAPLVLRAVDAAGNILASASAETAASGKVIRFNVNPLTDKVVSDAIAGRAAGTDKEFSGAAVDAARLAQANADLVKSIESALRTAGVNDAAVFDPVKSSYEYNGTGVDAVIESISHTRDSQTGATQLRAKLAGLQTDANGTAIPTLITASTPLDTAQVAIASNPALTFQKIQAWIDESNRCLALPSAQQLADANCRDADGTRMVSLQYKSNGRPFTEQLRTLFSESDGTAVQGSTLRNPQILFTTRSTGSTIDDVAVVELTVRQPRVGPLAGTVNEPVEYTTRVVFRRFDNLTQARAGNWIAYGNQRIYDSDVRNRFVRNVQLNPARQANTSGNAPSILESQLSISIPTTRYNPATATYVPIDVRAVRVTGPGLPAAGVVMTPNNIGGSEGNLTIHNKTGRVDTTAMINTNASNNFRLAATTLDGGALFAGYWPTNSASAADAPITDFSSMQAYSRYRLEYFLNSNAGNTTPDTVENITILSSTTPPAALASVPMNDISPSNALVTAPAAGGCSFRINWTNNPNASPAIGAYIFGNGNSPTGTFTQAIINAFVNPNLVNSRATGVTANAPNCTTGRVPDLAAGPGGGFRQIGLNTTQARKQYLSQISWNN